MIEMPLLTLKTGLRVANFSSPHAFTFTDGSVLPACTPERAVLGKLDAHEVEVDRGLWTDINLAFALNAKTIEMLTAAHVLWMAGQVDVVIVPFPVVKAMKADEDGLLWDPNDPTAHPFRTIRSADRVTKVNHADRFCA